MVLGFCIMAFIGCAQREIKNIDSQGEVIVCFGDSLTFGYGAEPNQDYPGILSRLSGWQVINAGVSGNTSVEALLRLNADVLEKKPFLAIIEFGPNDFLTKVSLQETEKNVCIMIDQVQARGAMVAIIDISTGPLFQEYRALYQRLAREKGVVFIPGVFLGIITNPSLKSDFLHPNSRGYRIIAGRIYQALLPYVEHNSRSRKIKK